MSSSQLEEVCKMNRSFFKVWSQQWDWYWDELIMNHCSVFFRTNSSILLCYVLSGLRPAPHGCVFHALRCVPSRLDASRCVSMHRDASMRPNASKRTSTRGMTLTNALYIKHYMVVRLGRRVVENSVLTHCMDAAIRP